MAVAKRNLIRAINRFKIINTIRIHELISRVDIAKSTGLSQAAITGITADLIKEGLLFEKEAGESIGGRRPILLALNPDGAFTIGVYLSIQHINVAIVNLEATILATHTFPLKEKNCSPEKIADEIFHAVQECIWKANFSRKQISGIGIAIPGLVDSSTGLIRFLPNYQWNKVNLRDIVHKKIGIPTYIENSANTLTLAEQWFGGGKGINNFIVITLEQGVGMGVVINGQLYHGQKGIAGEFGHTTVNPNGPLCRCGKKGCLEAIVGNHAILREAVTAAEKGKWKPENHDKITIDEIIQKARKGETCLKKIYAKAGQVLGIGLANLIELFNPAKIIISGKGVEAGDLLFNPMYKTVPRYISGKFNGDTEIVVRGWDQTDYARGAGALVLQEIYESPANRIIPAK